MSEDFVVVDGLRVAFVSEEGDELLVDLYGSAEPMCGSLRYTFPDDDERAESLASLRAWADDATTVSYIRRGEFVTLVDEDRLVQRACESVG